ncbi:hypothetical protein FB157_101240 [Streptomyces sp. BK340]|nr:hypothetical protein FB157_101240 [Streptomyces sp. BK340]
MKNTQVKEVHVRDVHVQDVGVQDIDVKGVPHVLGRAPQVLPFGSGFA